VAPKREHIVRFLSAFVVVAILAGIAPAVSAQTADPSTLDSITAKQYLVADTATGEVFTERDGGVRHGIASLTKVFTALVALERAPLNQQIIATDDDVFDSTSTLMTGFAPGNTYTVQDLIEGMLLESGNDAAHALARGIGFKEGDSSQDSVDRFVGWMNDKAVELGLQNTHFVNPHGLSDKDHYSTPRDIAVWMMYAVQNPDFLRLITTRQYTDSLGIEHISVNRGPEFISTYIGGKTGYDDSTGWCLIELGQQGDTILVSVTLDAVAPIDWYVDHQILLTYGFAALADRLAAGKPIGTNVIGFRAAAQPTEIPGEVAQEASPEPQAPSEQTGGAIGPVKVSGTPVSGPSVGTGDTGGNDRNWWPAALVLLVVLGLIGLRVLRMRPSSNPDEPTPPTT
jgi:D-alanyl-D-alanine carboxypeptidase